MANILGMKRTKDVRTMEIEITKALMKLSTNFNPLKQDGYIKEEYINQYNIYLIGGWWLGDYGYIGWVNNDDNSFALDVTPYNARVIYRILLNLNMNKIKVDNTNDDGVSVFIFYEGFKELLDGVVLLPNGCIYDYKNFIKSSAGNWANPQWYSADISKRLKKSIARGIWEDY